MSVLAVSQHKSVILTTENEQKQGSLSLQVLVLDVSCHSDIFYKLFLLLSIILMLYFFHFFGAL